MSTNYAANDVINMEDLFDGRLEQFGVRENFVKGETSASRRCLTDGYNNFLWVSGNQKVDLLTRYAPNGSPAGILSVIAEVFDTCFFSEHQPQFWGFETEDDWDNAMREMHEKDQAELYISIMKCVRGEPHDIQPRTNGMAMANIAKDLIARNPKLASPGCKEELMENVDRIWEADHCTTITLDEKDIATVLFAMTDVEDLPCA